jgi:ectoine hydroxylase-related dioxygenase (phytanoyl-CoA dioxygenase family)
MGGDRKLITHNFVEDGYLIVRNAINKKLIEEIHLLVNNAIAKNLNEKKIYRKYNFELEHDYFNKKIITLIKKYENFKALSIIWNEINSNNIPEKVFKEKKIFREITELLGRDLQHQSDPILTINLPGKNDPHKNYFFKKYHQEIWSGANHNTLQFWMPIFQSRTQDGISVIPGSHLWGHIPHRNRMPIDLPSKYKEVRLDLNIGDAVIFHSMLLHKSSTILKTSTPRLAMPCLIRNFKWENTSFENLKNWKIFSISNMTIIEKYLGNHFLSAFRLIDIKNQRLLDK